LVYCTKKKSGNPRDKYTQQRAFTRSDQLHYGGPGGGQIYTSKGEFQKLHSVVFVIAGTTLFGHLKQVLRYFYDIQITDRQNVDLQISGIKM
jgi:hypothetical protein